MKRITHDELQVFLRKHKLWLDDDPNGERADLYRADLRGADLRGADLCEADLCEADLCEADLRGADLRGARNLSVPIACPEEGSFIGFKKVRDDLIVKLLIPEDAKRCSATSRKCRCDKATVVSITNIDGTESQCTSTVSRWSSDFVYNVGEMVSVDNFEEDRFIECAPGIHFFITREEAVNY